MATDRVTAVGRRSTPPSPDHLKDAHLFVGLRPFPGVFNPTSCSGGLGCLRASRVLLRSKRFSCVGGSLCSAFQPCQKCPGASSVLGLTFAAPPTRGPPSSVSAVLWTNALGRLGNWSKLESDLWRHERQFLTPCGPTGSDFLCFTLSLGGLGGL